MFTRSPRSPPIPPSTTNVYRSKANKRKRKQITEDPLASTFTSFMEDSQQVNHSISNLGQSKDEHDLSCAIRIRKLPSKDRAWITCQTSNFFFKVENQDTTSYQTHTPQVTASSFSLPTPVLNSPNDFPKLYFRNTEIYLKLLTIKFKFLH